MVFFRDVPISSENAACLAGLILSILDIFWDVLGYGGALARWLMLKRTPKELHTQVVVDSRAWWVQSLFSGKSGSPSWKGICCWTSRFSMCHSLIACIFVCISVEYMVYLNDFQSWENAWSFGQTFAMMNTLTLVIFVCLRLHLLGKLVIAPDRSLTSIERIAHILHRLTSGIIAVSISWRLAYNLARGVLDIISALRDLRWQGIRILLDVILALIYVFFLIYSCMLIPPLFILFPIPLYGFVYEVLASLCIHVPVYIYQRFFEVKDRE